MASRIEAEEKVTDEVEKRRQKRVRERVLTLLSANAGDPEITPVELSDGAIRREVTQSLRPLLQEALDGLVEDGLIVSRSSGESPPRDLFSLASD